MCRTVLTAVSVVVFFMPTLLATVHVVPEPYPKIQEAIEVAAEGDTVLVLPGTYFENINFNGKPIVVASKYLLEQDPSLIAATIIDGAYPQKADTSSVVIFVSNEGPMSVLCGFTLMNGLGTEVPGSFDGGGIFVGAGCAPTIICNIIRNNNALRGGAVAIHGASSVFAHNAVYANNACHGGGIWLENSQATICHNVFYENVATAAGGACFSSGSNALFDHNVVAGGSAQEGGGIFCDSGEFIIEYCDFYANNGGDFVGCGTAELGDTSWGINFNRHATDCYYNIFRAPRLADPAGGDFSLECYSDLIDAGRGLSPFFPIGGKRTDIGIFEYPYLPVDLNGDGKINLADATALINIIFSDAPLPCPVWIADLDCSRYINITDIVAFIAYWAGYGPVPCALDPDPDTP
ncbi:MAG: hypothetical protein KAT58_08390 [candidate division Zixibacteria bacterium]|nr:hypothetical protein [candidate division Zixibacteria bacterium]